MAIISSILAIFVAALGLFGLTSFTVEQRTKEIGVRKAMGSSVVGIYLRNLQGNYYTCLSISTYCMSGNLLFCLQMAGELLLQDQPGLFQLYGRLLIALGIAILTISYRVLRAARVNPAQSLKYE